MRRIASCTRARSLSGPLERLEPGTMIRFRRIDSSLLNSWLVAQGLPDGLPSYRLRLWREEHASIAEVLGELRVYVQETLDDARRRIRKGFEDDLSPFRDTPTDPAANYPGFLHKITLFGYFGETLAVLAVEHWGAHGYTDWKVPALLFRFHDSEFQHLEIINERLIAGVGQDSDLTTERRPGRTGDDGLAFRIDSQNVITDILTLEAKCLARHNEATAGEAHRKLASGPARPTGVRELINLLADYETYEAETWRQALLKLWGGGYKSARRFDGVAYTCNNSPLQPVDRLSWLPAERPHSAYTVTRGLEAMEFQFGNLEAVITMLYRQA
jgi:hypothetical protein